MKNPFLPVVLTLAVGIPSSLVAASVGVFPSTLDVMPAFVGLFATIGLLAINAADYNERSTLPVPQLSPAARAARKAAPAAVPAGCVCAEAA